MYRPSITLFLLVMIMARLSWADLADPIYGPSTPLGSVVSAAGGFLCDMYRRYPNWLFPDPTGFAQIVKATADKLCDGGPPPLPPDVSGVAGGKCACVLYDVAITGKLPGTAPFSTTDRVRGPITVYGWQTNSSGNQKFGYFYYQSDCTTRTALNVVDNVTLADIDSGDVFARIDSITRVDGLPDDCGGQVPTYTPKVPTIPDVNRTAPVIIAPGITVVTPIVIIRPTANITLAPKVNINFNPTFNLPDLGINIKFDIAGVEINNTFNFGGGNGTYLPDPRPDPPTLPPSGSGDIDLSELYERLRILRILTEELKECACPDPPTLTQVNLGTANSGNVNLPPKTRFVTTQIVARPESYKFQSGINAATVLYAGWAWAAYPFVSLGDRDPVDAERKCFFVEPGAERFQWTLYKDFVLSAVAYYEV